MNNKVEVKPKVIEKEFENSFINLFEDIKSEVKENFNDLVVVNNIFLIFQKLFENKNKKGTYVECGVFKGGTLIPAVTFAENTDIDFNFIGVDTFEGFPNMEYHKNDYPGKL